jgi:hypothetical protein
MATTALAMLWMKEVEVARAVAVDEATEDVVETRDTRVASSEATVADKDCTCSESEERFRAVDEAAPAREEIDRAVEEAKLAMLVPTVRTEGLTEPGAPRYVMGILYCSTVPELVGTMAMSWLDVDS